MRPATLADLNAILEVCGQARGFQRRLGFVQWRDGYPSADVIAADIASMKAWVCIVGGKVAGYAVVDCSGDKEYYHMENVWKSSLPHAAIHRLAIGDRFRGCGLSRLILAEAERIVLSHSISVIKVDTGLENIVMHRLLSGMGYECRGSHTFSWGPRLAYEKILVI